MRISSGFFQRSSLVCCSKNKKESCGILKVISFFQLKFSWITVHFIRCMKEALIKQKGQKTFLKPFLIVLTYNLENQNKKSKVLGTSWLQVAWRWKIRSHDFEKGIWRFVFPIKYMWACQSGGELSARKACKEREWNCTILAIRNVKRAGSTFLETLLDVVNKTSSRISFGQHCIHVRQILSTSFSFIQLFLFADKDWWGSDKESNQDIGTSTKPLSLFLCCFTFSVAEKNLQSIKSAPGKSSRAQTGNLKTDTCKELCLVYWRKLQNAWQWELHYRIKQYVYQWKIVSQLYLHNPLLAVEQGECPVNR